MEPRCSVSLSWITVEEEQEEELEAKEGDTDHERGILRDRAAGEAERLRSDSTEDERWGICLVRVLSDESAWTETDEVVFFLVDKVVGGATGGEEVSETGATLVWTDCLWRNLSSCATFSLRKRHLIQNSLNLVLRRMSNLWSQAVHSLIKGQGWG